MRNFEFKIEMLKFPSRYRTYTHTHTPMTASPLFQNRKIAKKIYLPKLF